MAKIYITIPHALPWEEALNLRARLSNSLGLKLGFKKIDIKWNDRLADFSYNKHLVGIKRKNKKPATLNTVKGRIIITPVSVIITAENHSPKNTEELTMVMKLVTEKIFTVKPLPENAPLK